MSFPVFCTLSEDAVMYTWYMSAHPVEPIREVREHLAEVVDRARDQPTIITRRGREVAAVVSIDVLRRYEELDEQETLRIITERMASNEPGIPLEEVMRETLART